MAACSIYRRMSYDDFVANFTKVETCMTVPAFDAMTTTVRNNVRWEMISHEGSWKRNFSAGGCGNSPGTCTLEDRTLTRCMNSIFVLFIEALLLQNNV